MTETVEYNSYMCGKCLKPLYFLPNYNGVDASLYFYISSLQYGEQGQLIPVCMVCVTEMMTSSNYSLSEPTDDHPYAP